MPGLAVFSGRRGRALMEAGLRLGGALLQVLSAVLVARMANPTQAGYYFIGFAAATMIAVIGRAGFDQAMTRFVASDFALGQARHAQVTSALLMSTFLRRMAWACPALVFACLVGMYAPLAAGHAALASWLLVFVLAAPFLGIASLAGVALQAAGRPVLSVCSMFLLHNLVVMAAVALPQPLRDAGAFNFAFLGGAVVAAGFGALALRRTLHARVVTAGDAAPLAPATRNAEVQALARDNAWTVIGNLVLVWGPLGLIGSLSSPIEAARFGIAGRSAQLVSFALPALNFVLAPRFAALRATGGRDELRKTLLVSLMLSLALSSAVAIPMIAFAEPIMRSFGAEYASSAVLLVLLAAAQWANSASGAAIQFLAMTGAEKPLRRIFVTTASLAMAAGVPLVWLHGSTGAAQLALGSALLLNFCCIVVSLRSIRQPPAAVAVITQADHAGDERVRQAVPAA